MLPFLVTAICFFQVREVYKYRKPSTRRSYLTQQILLSEGDHPNISQPAPLNVPKDMEKGNEQRKRKNDRNPSDLSRSAEISQPSTLLYDCMVSEGWSTLPSWTYLLGLGAFPGHHSCSCILTVGICTDNPCQELKLHVGNSSFQSSSGLSLEMRCLNFASCKWERSREPKSLHVPCSPSPSASPLCHGVRHDLMNLQSDPVHGNSWVFYFLWRDSTAGTSYSMASGSSFTQIPPNQSVTLLAFSRYLNAPK